MKYFPEIIRILDQFRNQRIETLDKSFESRKEDKSFLLYEGIKQGSYSSDTIASNSLYSTSPEDPRYSTLKSRLKARLTNSLFHLDLRKAGYSEYARAVYACNRKSFMAQTLMNLGARNAGVGMALKTFEIGQKYHLTATCVEMAMLLRTNSAILNASTKYEHFDRQLKHHLQVLNAECSSWEYFERSQALLNQRTGGTKQFSEAIDSYVTELEPLRATISSFTFTLNYYRLLVLSHSAAGRHPEKIAAADEALQFLRANPHLAARVRLAEFYLQKLESYIVTRDFENGVKAAEECESLLAFGSNNWYGMSEYYFLLLMHSEHFIEAESLFRRATEHPRFKSLPELWQERWKIFELYLQYALQTIPEAETIPLRKQFDLQAFLRFVPSATKDKHGLYIAVLIIHILYLLEAKDFKGIINRMDSLRTYRSRYLRSSENVRSSLFFKLLTVMENNSFSYKLTRAKSDRYYKQLLAASSGEAETNDELLVIPYEWLWQRVLDKLREFELDYSKR